MSHFGATGLSHPLLDAMMTITGRSGDAAVVLDADQNGAAFQVEESHQLLGKLRATETIPFELQSRTLAAPDQIDQSDRVHPPPSARTATLDRCKHFTSIRARSMPPLSCLKSGAIWIGQVWRNRNRQVVLARTLKRCDEVALYGAMARAARRLCGWVGMSDVIDASVAVAVANSSHDDSKVTLLTSDPSDMRDLLSALHTLCRTLRQYDYVPLDESIASSSRQSVRLLLPRE